MTVLIASEPPEGEFSGDPLFEGVSFTVGRSDRLPSRGRTAGKTTLLRAIAGETSLQGGKLAFAKGTRVALHDQAPPLGFDLTLREYALSGARDLLDVEEGPGCPRRPWHRSARRGDAPALRRRPGQAGARRRLGPARPRDGDDAWPRVRGGRPGPAARDVLGRRFHTRLTRARPLRRTRPPAPRRADQPPRRPEPGVARARAGDDRRGGDPGRARPLVPRGGHHVRA